MTHNDRILIVDDEQSVRDILQQVLEAEGYDITLAHTGEHAMELFTQAPFPLVISDIRMPGMSGIELLKQITSVNADTQVIIITSHASIETALEALRLGVYDYLLKPFEDIGLIPPVVKRALDKIHLQQENHSLVERLKTSNEELHKVNLVLKDLAIRDGLTNLFNHRYFQETLSKEIGRCERYGTPFSLIFLDVDNFKLFNDNNGHVQGDNLLKQLASLIMNNIRNLDCAARYGGEEFVIILPETEKQHAVDTANKIRLAIYEHHFEGQETQPGGHVSVSMGVAVHPDDGAQTADLLKHADAALYQAKKAGKNRVYTAS